MKFICLQENLEKTLSLIGRITTGRTQLPMTTGVLIKALGKEITFIGTDLENTIKIITLGKVEKEGTILVPIKTLVEIVNNLPKEQVTIETDTMLVKIKSGKYEVKINGISGDEFPELEKDGKGQKMSIENFLPHIKVVSFASAQEESRAALTGTLIVFRDEGVSLVATDGYRLSIKQVRVPVKTSGFFIIPSHMLLEIARVYIEKEKEQEGQTESFLTLDRDKNQAVFTLDETTIFTRLIEGQFPQYEKIIPQSFTTRAVFEKDEFVTAVRLSAIFAKEAANIVRMKITKDALVLSANAPQVGENICEVEASFEGDENEIAFNSRFLLDFLANVDTKEIAFEMTGPLNPGVFKIPGDDSYLHIIMPVRVQNQ